MNSNHIRTAHLTVLGSLNTDIVSHVRQLPVAGETVSGTALERAPGGKGANHAVAAAKLGAHVRLVGCVGADSEGGGCSTAYGGQGSTYQG